MQARKIYLRPSARPLLEIAPTRVATLLAQYLNLIEAHAQSVGVAAARTEVSGHLDPEDGSRLLAITHLARVSPVDMMAYRSHLGTEIEGWIRRLSPVDVDLVQEWFILEVRQDPEAT